MRDLLLQCSGVAAIAVAMIHGVLGETKIFGNANNTTIEPPRLRTLLRLVWQAGTVAWIGGGVLLIAAVDGVGAGAALDRRDHGRGVCLWRAGKRLGQARPAFWLDVSAPWSRWRLPGISGSVQGEAWCRDAFTRSRHGGS